MYLLSVPNWLWIALSAVGGGILTAILLPIVIYFFVRIFNNRRLEVRQGTLLQGLEKKHWNLPLILTNKSYSSIKNVIVYLKIGFSKEDLREDPNIITFNAVTLFDHLLTLSWSKQLGDRIVPYTNINQGEPADLNLFRIHPIDNDVILLQIPSENGFYHHSGRTGRLLLNGDKNYSFHILITADNMTPIRKYFTFYHKKDKPYIVEEA
jgi:hypothetical protein